MSGWRTATAFAAALVAVDVAVAPAAGQHDEAAKEARVGGALKLEVPASLKAEHEEIHGALVKATKVAGSVGEAARELARVLHPHFVREEQVAMPPLALLAPLAAGEWRAGMAEVLPLTDTLRAELPQMLREHEAIGAAAKRLGEAARAAGNEEVVHLAEALGNHAQLEEDLYYPAAVLVGDLVRARQKPES